MIDLVKWALLALATFTAIGLGTFLAAALALARRADQRRDADITLPQAASSQDDDPPTPRADAPSADSDEPAPPDG